MDPSTRQFLDVMRTVTVVLGFGPFALRLFFYFRPLDSEGRRPLRWAIPRLLANLGWGIGFALMVLSRGETASWIGLAVLVTFGALDLWLMLANERTRRRAERVGFE